MTKSAFLRDFRDAAAGATRGCIVLERPDIVRDLVRKHGATRYHPARHRAGGDRGDDAAAKPAQPGNEIPEDHWMYRFAKKHWFFGFGAYS